MKHMLYKGHLLVPHQIKDTSRKRELVEEVKSHFDRWLQQIRIVLMQGKHVIVEIALDLSRPLRFTF